MSPRIRFLIIFILIAVGAVALLLNMGVFIVALAWSMAFFLTIAYFIFGTVNGALITLNRGQVDKAEKLLASTYRTSWLMKSHRALYFFTKGLIALYKGNSQQGSGQQVYLEEGEHALLQSVNIGLPGKRYRAMAYLNLAHLAFKNRQKSKVLKYTEKVRDNMGKDLRLQKNLEELEAAIEKMP